MVVEISVAVIALAFVFLVVFIIITTKALRVTLGEVNATLVGIRKHLDEIGTEAKKATEHVDMLSQDLNSKMESLTPLFNAFSNVGDYLEQKSKSYKLEADICALRNDADEAEMEAENAEGTKLKGVAGDVLDLVGTGFRLWQNLNKRR